MPTVLHLGVHVAALEAAGRRLVDDAVEAGLAAAVPTCPGWDVAELLAHTAMVHRSVIAQLQGTDPAAVPDEVELRAVVVDRPTFVHDGVVELAEVLWAAPADLEALAFLPDAPPPRRFWARRQSHETTIHAVDALAARLGRLPVAAEVDVGADLAVDGIDELLRGFFTRGRSKLYDGAPFTFAVVPTDAGRCWVVHVDERLTVDPGDPDPAGVETTMTGTAAELYLGLWNRGAELTVTGRGDLAERWASSQRVIWS